MVSKGKGERVEVTFDVQDEVDTEEQMYDEESEEDTVRFGINFQVTVTKPGHNDKIVFFCTAQDQVRVDNVQYIPAGKSADSEDLYSGPVFDKLSEDLQESVLDYLAERGIDDDMAFFVISYSEQKEQAEYVNWLNKLLLFVEK